jgi:protein arginine N-methyltransferase 5
VRIKVERILKKEIDWAAHLGLPFIIFDLQPGIETFAGIIDIALDLPYTQCLIRVPVNDWNGWNKLRMTCGHHPKLQVVLRLDEPTVEDKLLALWIAEPIKVVNIPSHLFLKNKAGYPVLSKPFQRFCHRLMDSEVKFMISSPTESNLHQYADYVAFLQSSKPSKSVIDQFASGYHDSLQTPLQVR